MMADDLRRDDAQGTTARTAEDAAAQHDGGGRPGDSDAATQHDVGSQGGSGSDDAMTFWGHVDVLRSSLIRMVLAVVAAGIGCFCFKDLLFDFVLAPARSDFFVYRLMGAEPFHISFVNTELTGQFMMHMKVAFMMGLFVALPYLLYVLFRFVSPALYVNERRASTRILVWSYCMFLIGSAINYVSIFPLTVRFLGTYQVSEDVANLLSLSSYVDTMLMMTLVFGILFEIPVVCWLLARFSLLKSSWMKRYRRHAIVVILIVAAIITPTTDMFTLGIVSLPIWLLYESSIYIVRRTNA